MLRERRCQTNQYALMFSDIDWLPLTTETVTDVLLCEHCVFVYLWLPTAHRNGTGASAHLCETHRVYCHTEYSDAWRQNAWGHSKYFSKISQRVVVMRETLRLLSQTLPIPEFGRSGIVLIDSDIVLRRNVLARMPLVSKNIVIQQEVPCVTYPHQRCANGGFYWLTVSEFSIQFLSDVIECMHALGIPDQDALDVVLHKNQQHVHYLNTSLYANGYTLRNDRTFDLQNAAMLHTNWFTTFERKTAVLAHVRVLYGSRNFCKYKLI